VADAEWISTLFRHGLLEPSFIPERLIRNLREYSRLHRSFVQERSRYSNRLEKFLQTHGFKLSSVLSSILGVSGRRLLYILSKKGKLTFEDVHAAVDKNVKKPVEEIRLAICGQLDYSECKYLNLLLKKIDAMDDEISQLHAAMLELALPYKIQLEQLDYYSGN
jgi:chromatin segregation and condensation protein Rec8/ScpA/Scc1 (kleisin family)